jgi:L-arabinose isomerase
MGFGGKTRLPKVGLLCIGSKRFRGLGKGTANGTYENRVSRETQAILDELSDDVEMLFTGDIYTEVDLNKALSTFMDERVDCILASFHSWAEDDVWIRFLRDHNKDTPLIFFYNSKQRIPFTACDNEDDFTEFLSSGGLVGMLVGSGSIPRTGNTAYVVVGSIARKSQEIVQYAQVCKVSSLIKAARFGLMPAYNEIMWSTYLDPYSFFLHGPEVKFITYDELFEISQGVSEDEIGHWYDLLSERYVTEESVDPEKFRASLQYSIGLSEVMKSYDLDALTLNDVDMRLFEKIGLRPGFYHHSINEALSVLCPEGDLGMTTAVFLLKQFSQEQVNVIEPFYIDEEKNLFCAGHAGPNDYSYPGSESFVRVAVDTRFARTSYRYAGAPFAWLRIPPGEMTMVHVSQAAKGLKMIAGRIESLPGQHTINGYTHSEFRPHEGSLEELFTKLLTIGTTQHFAVAAGDYTTQLRQFADLVGIEFHSV